MGAFWDKLSMDEAKDVIVISFDTVMLEVFGFKSKSSTLVILSQQLNLPIICRGNWLGKQSLVILLVEFILLTHLLVHLSFPVFQCLIQLTQTRSPIHL
ncbi:hypothetical protein C5167_042113 [Papaver somniferum]|nr:hypothetical protein C5167_042113 [Papaver somniferum]